MGNHIAVLVHNPRCSKSRQTLALLNEKGIDVEVREYLKAPLDEGELTALIKQLDGPASALIRQREAQDAGLTDDPSAMSATAIARWLAEHPKSLQRPVVLTDNGARIGRPPEAVLALFD